MLIENQTRNTMVASDAIIAKNIFQKALGLLLHSSAVPLVLKTRFGIHTFFLRYEIDVLILDSTNRVVDMNPYMKSWRIFTWNPNYSLVLELPGGRIGESKTQIGDQLVLE
jgi:uncharacterized membrane protein (UPF0127 family)